MYTHSWIHGGIQSIATENLHTNCPNIIVHTSRKFEVECLTGRKNGFAQSFSWPRYLNPLFFNMRSDIYHHCPIFTTQFSNICDIFARSKVGQIHFFRPVTETNRIWFAEIQINNSYVLLFLTISFSFFFFLQYNVILNWVGWLYRLCPSKHKLGK